MAKVVEICDYPSFPVWTVDMDTGLADFFVPRPAPERRRPLQSLQVNTAG